MVNGEVISEMEEVSNAGVMAPVMKANGRKIKHMVMESLSTQMVTHIKEIGSIIRLMGRANICISMERCMWVSGNEISRRVKELKLGLMNQNFKDNT